MPPLGESRVCDWMSTAVRTISPHTPLPRIKSMMVAHHVHRLPVVDGARLVGIVTLGDVRNAFPSDVLDPLPPQQQTRVTRVRAMELMRADVVTITPDAPLVTAAQQMLTHRISGLPVVDGDRLVGMITKSDVCRAVIAQQWAAVPMLETPGAMLAVNGDVAAHVA